MRAPLPIPRIMLRTAAVWAAVACRGAADTRESRYVAGVDDTDRGGWAARRVTWPAFAVAAPAVPAIEARREQARYQALRCPSRPVASRAARPRGTRTQPLAASSPHSHNGRHG